jgi:hypothetical protein
MEFGLSAFGMMSGLAILLADGNGRGGGDIEEDPVTNIVGRWAGDRIVIAGDYADKGRFVTKKDVYGLLDEETKGPLARKEITLYSLASQKYKDISYDVLFALMADGYARETIVNQNKSSDEVKDFNKIHLQLAKNKNDLALLVGQLKTDAGKSILERFFKLDTATRVEV